MTNRFTSIGRPLDRNYSSNRAIALLTLLVAAIGFLVVMLSGVPVVPSVLRGTGLAIGFFLAWAIAREVDPDHDAAAFLAAALSLIPLAILGRPDYAAVVLALLSLRMVNRTVGPAARPVDTIGILALVAVAAWRGHAAVVLVAVAAFLLDSLLKVGHRIHFAAAGVSLGLLAVAAANLEWGGSQDTPDIVAWLAVASTAPFLILIRASGTPKSVSDLDGKRLSGRRLRASQWLCFLLVAAVVGSTGRAGLMLLSPLWAAIVGTGLGALMWRVRAARH